VSTLRTADRIGGLPCSEYPAAARSARKPESKAWNHISATATMSRRGAAGGGRFDHGVVLAVSLAWSSCGAELITDNPHGDMTTHVRTVATQAFSCGCGPTSRRWVGRPGVTTVAICPFDTWRRCPDVMGRAVAEHDRPRTVAYFCGALSACGPAR